MRSIAVAALLVAATLGLGPAAAAAADPLDHHAAAPDNGVSMLAVSLTAGGAVAAVGSGVAFAVNRRRRPAPAPPDRDPGPDGDVGHTRSDAFAS